MKLAIVLSLFFTATFSANPSWAQMGLEGFSTGRYEIKKSKVRKPSADVTTETSEVKVPGVTIQREKTETSSPASAATKPATKEATAPIVVITTKPPTPLVNPIENPKVEEPSISEQAESLFSSKTEKVYEFYRVQVHPDDVRNNRVELEVAPLLTYVDSKSNYAYRNYQSFFNALKLKTNIWFTPRIGVSGQFLMSSAADVDGVASTSRIPVKYEYLDLGLNFRKFFGVSRLSNSVEFGLLFSDNKVNFESNNTSRARLRTNGVGASIKTRIPVSESYAWILGGSYFPRLQHSENQPATNLSSGSSIENTRIGLETGGEFKFDRESQMIWSLGVSTERNVFDGTAAALDPSTGVAPKNVSVTNSAFMFSLGYRWGH